MSKKEIKLQQREYTSTDGITKYKQCRINIPNEIIKKMGWENKKEQVIITIFIESKKKEKRIILKNKE